MYEPVFLYRIKRGHTSPLFLGGGEWKNFGLAFKSNVQNRPKSWKSCLYLKQYVSYWNVIFYRKGLKGGHASLLFGGGGGKIFGPVFKSNVQNGHKFRKSCLYLKQYGSYWNVDFYRIRLKRGHAPPPFLGGVEKFLVPHSKVMSKRGLNPENHVYISNGMVVTEMSIFTI